MLSLNHVSFSNRCLDTIQLGDKSCDLSFFSIESSEKILFGIKYSTIESSRLYCV